MKVAVTASDIRGKNVGGVVDALYRRFCALTNKGLATLKEVDTFADPGDVRRGGSGIFFTASGHVGEGGTKLLQVNVYQSGVESSAVSLFDGLTTKIRGDLVPKLEAVGFLCTVEAVETPITDFVTHKLVVGVSVAPEP